MRGATRQIQKESILTGLSGLVKPVSIAVSVVSIMVAVILLLLQLGNKPVTQLHVNAGLNHVSLPDIRAQLTSVFPAGYIYLDVDKAQQALLAMPMVAKAKVEKIWPDQLKVEIEEERPVAIWNQKNMLSQHGEVLPVAFEQLALPQLTGLKGASTLVMQHYLLFNRWSKRHQLSLVQLRQSAAGWLLVYGNGLRLWLDSDRAMAGLKQLEKVVDQISLEKVASIDMRYEQGFSVAWKAQSNQQG